MSQLRVVLRVVGQLLLAMAAIIGTALVFRALLLPALLWAFDPDPVLATQLKRFGTLISAMLGYWLYVRFFRKRPVNELRPALAGVALGALAGAALIALALLPLFAFGIYAVTAHQGLQWGLLEVAGFLLVAAMLEELVYRGVLFQTLETAWGTLPALCLQAVVFGMVHLENVFAMDGNAWDMVATVVSVTLLGAMWALLFVLFRNLWICGLNHFAWNFTILCSGVPLSGIDDWRDSAPVRTEYRGPDWLTGGLFGPENSLLTLVVVALVVGVLLHFARKRGRLFGAAAMDHGR
ncbi:lysostaphin resistance A-like protein [Arenimonas aestuarii]